MTHTLRRKLAVAATLLALSLPALAVPDEAALERSGPGRVLLTWVTPPADAGTTYRIRLAATPDAVAAAQARPVPARDGRLALEHAAGERPYVRIEDEAGRHLTVAERVLPLQGGVNFRDLGGYATADGRRVRWGKLFRSGDNSQLTDADHAYLRRLGIRTVCDLRSNDERARAPTRAERFGDGVAYVAWDYAQVMDGDQEAFGAVLRDSPDPAAAASEMMAGFYRQMPQGFADRFRTVFDALADGDGMLFQCSAGKDRTGLTAALLLAALGVERDQIMADYLLSNRYADRIAARHMPAEGEADDNPAMAMFARLPAEVRDAFMGVKPAYLQAAFDGIDADYGSLDAYFEKALGLSADDLQALRARYLEPAR